MEHVVADPAAYQLLFTAKHSWQRSDKMKIMIQGLQAVTVELAGILLIVWLMFGCASWGIRTTRSEQSDWGRNGSAILNSLNTQFTEVIPDAATGRSLALFKRT
jgi:hypothetical protein